MFAVRSVHVPVEWLMGGEEGINRLEQSIGCFGVNYLDGENQEPCSLWLLFGKARLHEKLNNRDSQQIQPGEEKVNPVL